MSNLAWVDIETTGLRPKDDAILEIGIVITTKKLEVVVHERWVIAPSRPARITDIDAVVWEMHHDNGLWKESLSSQLTIPICAGRAVALIREYDAENSPACGSSVHFDREFLKEQAPYLNEVFHYRNIDVSTIKNLTQIFQPEVYETRPRGEKKHRTIEDLIDSIEELKHYAKALGWSL